MRNNNIDHLSGRKHKKAIRSRRRARARAVGDVYLPTVNQKPKQTRCVRYTQSMSIPTNLTFDTRDIRNMLGFVRGGQTDYYPLIDSFKLKRVGITLMPGDSTSGAGLFAFSWQGDNAPEFRDTFLVGNTSPNHMSFRPPLGSTAYFWHDDQGSAEPLYSISLTNNSVEVYMDIEVEYIFQDGGITSIALTNPAAFTGVASRSLPITSGEFMAIELSNVS